MYDENINLCKKCDKACHHEWCGPCQINNLKENFRNWTSENEKIDNLVQEMQLKISYYNDTVFEWIPYDQLEIIKEIGKATVNFAIWKDGPLYYDEYEQIYKKTCPNKKVTLKYLYNSQNITNELLNEVKSFSIKRYGIDIPYIYGISQNIETKDYIMVLYDGYCEKCGEIYTDIKKKWCKPCQIINLKENLGNWTSENEKIDNFIQTIQLDINRYHNIIFEWIPYNQFDIIKEIDKSDFVTVYLAVWKSGPLEYDHYKKEYTRINNIKVALKFLSNSQNIIDEFSNEIKICSIIPTDSFNICEIFFKIYGISQNPNTKDYIIVIKGACCKKCGDKYIYEYVHYKKLNWCKQCSINELNKVCIKSGSEEIDNIVQKMQLKIDGCEDIIFEWIPFNQFDNIEKIKNDGFVTIYLAIWKDGPLYYKGNKETYKRKSYNNYKKVTLKYLQNIDNQFLNDEYDQFDEINKIENNGFEMLHLALWKDGQLKYNKYKNLYIRINNKKVILKCIYNSQNIIDEFLNEVKSYYLNKYNIKIYGISQNPNTKDYIMVLQEFNDIKQISKDEFGTLHLATWKDNVEVSLKHLYNSQNNTDEFLNKVESYSNKCGISQNPDTNDYIIVSVNRFCQNCGNQYTNPEYGWSIWKDGPLEFDDAIFIKGYIRTNNKRVILKCIYNSQNITNEILSEAKSYSIKYSDNLPSIYGISQNPSTNDYILVLQDGYCEKCAEIYTDIKEKWLVEWIPYNQFDNIEEIGTGGFATVYSAKWEDNILHYNASEKKYERYKNLNRTVALKCLYDSQNITNEFLNEAKSYSIEEHFDTNHILPIYGISQNPDTGNYILVLKYASEGNLNEYINKIYHWPDKLELLIGIINGLKKIHENQMCWDPNPNNRPNAAKVEEFIQLFHNSYHNKYDNGDTEIKKQFNESEKYRKANPLSTENTQLTTHPEAYYTSRLLNPYTKDLLKCDNNSVMIDFTKSSIKNEND
ncbi:uncharacterized protein OCT59_013059 [Rhizophagus irregularis]|uniref:uncharacterized protein n=1 Tax=Rhizophagus irregularis TaxID=588596 RepID=UPI003329B8CF|nr:hypothetical protein OCT59_013059 [Rhizophagus irregularis]